jgi:dTDP-glucose pyrophosphorylase/predicted transcriptional regulator
MGNYRDRLQIIADILAIASKRAKKTQIMYQANLSYKLLCRYLHEVLDSGLVSFENENCYVLTAKGKEFLSQHEEYSKHCKTLEEQFNHTNTAKTWLEKMCSGNSAVIANFNKAPRKRTMLNTMPRTTKGVVLAAGEGTRIREITYGAFPKELLPIGNVPTIRFPIEALKLAGIEDILIVIAPQTKHGIIDGLQSGERLGVNISYVVQEKNEKSQSGLGSAILSTRGRIQSDEDFVVACGDSILCDFSSSSPFDCLKPLLKIHKSTSAIATVMVHPTKVDPTRFGVVKFRSFHEENGVFYGELESLVEKPNLETAKNFSLNGYNYIAVGYYVFKPKIFSYIEKTKPGARNEVQITDAIALALENGERVYAVTHARNKGKDMVPCEYWDVGVPEDYRKANRRLLDMNLDRLMG